MTDAVTFPHLILPGEILSTILSQPVKIGPGLRHTTLPNDTTVIQATQAGLLQQPKPKEFFVEYNSRRVPPPERDFLTLVHSSSRRTSHRSNNSKIIRDIPCRHQFCTFCHIIGPCIRIRDKTESSTIADNTTRLRPCRDCK